MRYYSVLAGAATGLGQRRKHPCREHTRTSSLTMIYIPIQAVSGPLGEEEVVKNGGDEGTMINRVIEVLSEYFRIRFLRSGLRNAHF
jgi:hypothetical protein